MTPQEKRAVAKLAGALKTTLKDMKRARLVKT